jgi:hypothetical protein
MGRTAKVIVEYVCEYGDSCAFNYAHEEVYTMLMDNDIDMWTSDEFNEACADRWEIRRKDELQQYVNKLKKLPPDKTNKYFKKNQDHRGYTNKYVLEVLTEWLEAYDKEDDVIRIEWF